MFYTAQGEHPSGVVQYSAGRCLPATDASNDVLVPSSTDVSGRRTAVVVGSATAAVVGVVAVVAVVATGLRSQAQG